MSNPKHGGAGRNQGRKPDPNKKVARNIKLRPQLWGDIRSAAARQNVPMVRIIELALADWLEKESKQQ